MRLMLSPCKSLQKYNLWLMLGQLFKCVKLILNKLQLFIRFICFYNLFLSLFSRSIKNTSICDAIYYTHSSISNYLRYITNPPRISSWELSVWENSPHSLQVIRDSIQFENYRRINPGFPTVLKVNIWTNSCVHRNSFAEI